MLARSLFSLLLLVAITCVAPREARAQGASYSPERVTFLSADGNTVLTGYLYRPSRSFGPAPAVVMLHGRGGAYSSLARGVYDSTTLSARHRKWGEGFAERGFAALMVDDFSAFGFAAGFERHSYRQRPAALSEVDRRPLHAYGALAYLQSHPGIDRDRVGLIGWSNGGSAALATVSDELFGGRFSHSFRAALAMYPGCGLKQKFAERPYRSHAPVHILVGDEDREVSPHKCQQLASRSRAAGAKVDLTVYKGAQHGFDSPVPANRRPSNGETAEAATQAVFGFFDNHLRHKSQICTNCARVIVAFLEKPRRLQGSLAR